MFGTRWRLFRLLGIPVFVDVSWLIILGLLTLSLASVFPGLMQGYFPGHALDLGPVGYWLMALVTAVAFFGCILLHELGHALAARAQRMPIRGITLFLFGGVAEIGEEPPSAKGEFFMVIAGPVVSVFLALVSGLFSWVGYASGWAPPVVLVLGYLAFINLLVLGFNLVPAFPLDGGRVLRAILWGWTGSLRRATWWASLAGQGFAWLLIFWGVMQFFVGNWLGGIWIGLIGLFLKNAAQSGYQQVLVQQALWGEPVARLMNHEPIAVPPSLDMLSWVQEYVLRYHRTTFPVVVDGHLKGYIDTQMLAGIPRTDWERHTVGDVMERDLTLMVIPLRTDLYQALERMERNRLTHLFVMEDDRLFGVISLKDLVNLLSLRIALEGEDRLELDAVRPASAKPSRRPLSSRNQVEENQPC